MDILSEQDIIPLVLYLDRHSKAVQIDLNEVSSNIPRLNRIAEKLQRIGMIDIDIANRPRRTITYSITKKGRELADLFKQAQDLAMSD